MKSLSGAQVWEGEAFLRTHKMLLAEGKLSSQAMSGFGPGWGGNAQLLWTEGQKGSVLDLEILVGKQGAYKVSLALTQGPDFGIIQAQVDTKWSPFVFDGYLPHRDAGRFERTRDVPTGRGSREDQTQDPR